MTASSNSSSNEQWEIAFLQSGQENDDDEDDHGVPTDAVHKSHSADIDDADEAVEVGEDGPAVRCAQFT